MRLSGITPESLVDGPGLRYVLFTQGCTHHCPGCHNPESWDTDSGKEFTVTQIIRLLKQQKNIIKGISFSGGEPYLQACELAQVAMAARQTGMDVVTYTGFTYEQLMELGNNNEDITAFTDASDILIDGKYIHELKTTTLPFRGSSNQRIINLVETRKKGRIVLWKEE